MKKQKHPILTRRAWRKADVEDVEEALEVQQKNSILWWKRGSPQTA